MVREWVSETMRVQYEDHLDDNRRHTFGVECVGA